MDGKIATYTKKSKWITGEQARNKVHEDRSRYMSIMIGVGTAIADDPMLSSRIENGRQPIRIVCDSHLSLPIDSQIVQTAKDIHTIIATTCKDKTKHDLYKHCEVILVAEREGEVDLKELMSILAKKKIDSILLEGGATLNWSAIQSNIVNKVQVYIAPKFFGGKDAISPIGGLGIEDPKFAINLTEPKITTLGDDILIESRIIPLCNGEARGG